MKRSRREVLAGLAIALASLVILVLPPSAVTGPDLLRIDRRNRDRRLGRRHARRVGHRDQHRNEPEAFRESRMRQATTGSSTWCLPTTGSTWRCPASST